MTAFLQVKNRAISTLAGDIADDAVALTVAAGEGGKFPATFPFHITIEDEILKCTNRVGDVLTITRAQEGTAAAAHTAGEAVELRITAEIIEELQKVSGGGLYGINVEVLIGAKTLTPGTDKIYQYLDEGGADRIITLDTASATAGDRFVIRHNGRYNDTHELMVKQAATTLDKIYAGAIKGFIFNGTDWVPFTTGTGEDDTKRFQVAIGCWAKAYGYGTAIGRDAKANTDGVAVGLRADGYTYGAAIGVDARGEDFGVAIGYKAQGYGYGVGIGFYTKTNLERYSIALGYFSQVLRTAETTINIDGGTTQKNNVVQGRWARTTTDDTPVEIFCGGRANERFTIRAISALAFKMTIVARDNVANEVAMYTVVGIIKRDGANNTVMSNCTVTTVFEDDAAWDVAVTADDANEALIITVTGDAANPVQWAVRMDGVETHF